MFKDFDALNDGEKKICVKTQHNYPEHPPKPQSRNSQHIHSNRFINEKQSCVADNV